MKKLEYETAAMAGEPEDGGKKQTKIWNVYWKNAEITTEYWKKYWNVCWKYWKKSKFEKKSLEDSVSTVECAIMKGNPIDDQYFKISMFFSLCVNV